MFSPKDLFLTKLRRIFPIPTYDGYLLCFGENGDVYIINMFRMRLLKHSSFDIDCVKHISLVKVDQSNIWILLTDIKGKISTWQIQTNVDGMNLQTICSESDFDIDFKLKKALILPDEYSKDYKLVYSEEVLQIGKKNTSQTILVITNKEVNIVHLSDDVEDIVEIDKFKGIGDIIFATSIQKNEGIYILIITDTYDCYIDRYDQIPEKTAPLIMVNLLEKSEINNHPISSSRLEEL